MRDIKKYEVFHKSHTMTLEIYKITGDFPVEEKYGLTNQLRRAAYSIPMNLIEGGARTGEKEFAQFINISIGSCEEVRYQLLLAKDLHYLSDEDYNRLDKEYEGIKQMLTSLLKAVNTKKEEI